MGYLRKPTVTKVKWPISSRADAFLKRHDFKDAKDEKNSNPPKQLNLILLIGAFCLKGVAQNRSNRPGKIGPSSSLWPHWLMVMGGHTQQECIWVVLWKASQSGVLPQQACHVSNCYCSNRTKPLLLPAIYPKLIVGWKCRVNSIAISEVNFIFLMSHIMGTFPEIDPYTLYWSENMT